MNDVPALAVEGLVKRYPGTVALDGLSLQVRRHEVLGLVGENGAGKSTLLKALVGLARPDAGTIAVGGQLVHFRSVTQAAAAGVGMVFQEQSLIPNITVAENILLGAEGAGVRRGWYRWRHLNELAQAQLDKIGSTVRPDVVTETLSFAQRQMVEIAKVLTIEERARTEPVILLDEPTSVLERDEIEVLFRLIDRLRERASVVFVSHRLDEVLRISDRVYVLRDGRAVADIDPADADATSLHRLMIGRDAAGGHYGEAAQVDCTDRPVRLSVAGLTRRACFDDVTFDVRAGEVVGVVGVVGSGREELCRTLFGSDPTDAGRLTLDGAPVRLSSPRAAVGLGIGYVPSERRHEGMVASMSVAENVSLPHMGDMCRGPFLDRRAERSAASSWVERLRIKTPSTAAPLGTLSGGNQQKVVLARWLVSERLRVLILDHPTRGLDVGAKTEVYAVVRDLALRGVAVLLLADSLEETIGLSHRVIVMKDGRVADIVDTPPQDKPDPVRLLELMV